MRKTMTFLTVAALALGMLAPAAAAHHKDGHERGGPHDRAEVVKCQWEEITEAQEVGTDEEGAPLFEEVVIGFTYAGYHTISIPEHAAADQVEAGDALEPVEDGDYSELCLEIMPALDDEGEDDEGEDED